MRLLAIVAIALAVVACEPVATTASSSPGSSIDERVLDTVAPGFIVAGYLEALESGDCTLAGRFAAASLVKGNGAICGSVHVTGYRLVGGPKAVSATELVYGVELTTDGSADGSIPAGRTMWFIDLVRQPSGGWRVASGGSGP